MTEILQLLKDFDAVGVAALIAFLAHKAIQYLRAEITLLREEKVDLIAELRDEREARLTDKDTAATHHIESVVRLEGFVQEMTRAIETDQALLAKVARKLEIEL